MAILAIAALTSTVNTQKQFVFTNNYKEVFNKIREARTYAVTQKAVDLGAGRQGIPSAYGVYISNNGTQIQVTVFADLTSSTTQNGFDDASASAKDVTIGQSYSFDATKYALAVVGSDEQSLNITNGNSLTLLYSPAETRVVVTGHTDAPSSNFTFADSYVTLTLSDSTIVSLSKKMTIFLQSGIIEAIDADNLFQAKLPANPQP